MMRRPIAIVLGVGGVEPSDHIINPLWAMHWQWCGCSISRPAEQHHRPEAVDMIRMEMSQEKPLDLSAWYPHQRNVARTAFPRVDHDDPFARDHDRARPSAFAIGQRRTGAAKCDMQAIRQVSHNIPSNPILRPAGKDGYADLCLKMVKRERTTNKRNRNA
jgi:hypothetical protein